MAPTPRNVRNFWIELDVDGKKIPIRTGPRHSDGGFSLTIRQRHLGKVLTAATIQGHSDGELITLDIKSQNDHSVFTTIR